MSKRTYVIKHNGRAYMGGPAGWTDLQSQAQRFNSRADALAAKNPAWTCCKVVRLRRKATGWVVKRGFNNENGVQDLLGGCIAGYIGEDHGSRRDPYVFRSKAEAFAAARSGLGLGYRRVFRVVKKRGAR